MFSAHDTINLAMKSTGVNSKVRERSLTTGTAPATRHALMMARFESERETERDRERDRERP